MPIFVYTTSTSSVSKSISNKLKCMFVTPKNETLQWHERQNAQESMYKFRMEKMYLSNTHLSHFKLLQFPEVTNLLSTG
jgi:hypothetical protein